MTILTEKDIQHIKEGSTAPLENLYRMVYETSMSKMKHIANCSKDDAEDAMMDAIITLRDAIMADRYENKNVSAYLITVAINKFRNKRKRDQRLTDYNPSVIEHLLTDESSENDQQMKKVKAILMSINQITGKCNALLTRNLIDGIILKDLVAELDYSNYDVIKTSKSRCIKKLRSLVSELLNK